MKFFHLSDLHIGKQLHYYNLKEDQRYILREIVDYAGQLHPDAIVIAGDIYDKSAPSAEAVSIFDEFLTKISEIMPRISVLIISGNHDSSERLEYASEILKKEKIYLAGDVPRTEEEHLKKVTLEDEYGEVDFYLLPFMKPSYVRKIFEEEMLSYTDAVGNMIDREKIDFKNKRNVLISHQFYAGKDRPETCDSETISVGGLDQVSTSVLHGFDYVALGHLHGAQNLTIDDEGNIESDNGRACDHGKKYSCIRYCGTPLKYSVSEVNQEKTLTVVEMSGKEDGVQVKTVPLHPLHDVKKKRGKLQEILQNATEEERGDYISVTLTDELEPYKPKEQLQQIFERILEINIDNTRTRKQLELLEETMILKNPMTNFEDFYFEIQGKELSEKERNIMEKIISEAGEEV